MSNQPRYTASISLLADLHFVVLGLGSLTAVLAAPLEES